MTQIQECKIATYAIWNAACAGKAACCVEKYFDFPVVIIITS